MVQNHQNIDSESTLLFLSPAVTFFRSDTSTHIRSQKSSLSIINPQAADLILQILFAIQTPCSALGLKQKLHRYHPESIQKVLDTLLHYEFVKFSVEEKAKTGAFDFFNFNGFGANWIQYIHNKSEYKINFSPINQEQIRDKKFVPQQCGEQQQHPSALGIFCLPNYDLNAVTSLNEKLQPLKISWGLLYHHENSLCFSMYKGYEAPCAVCSVPPSIMGNAVHEVLFRSYQDETLSSVLIACSFIQTCLEQLGTDSDLVYNYLQTIDLGSGEKSKIRRYWDPLCFQCGKKHI